MRLFRLTFLYAIAIGCLVCALESNPDETREMIDRLLAQKELTTADRSELVSHASTILDAAAATDREQALLWARVLSRLPTADPVPDEELAMFDQALTTVLPLILTIHRDLIPDFTPHRLRSPEASGGILDLSGEPPPPVDPQVVAERQRKLAENEQQFHLKLNWQTLSLHVKRILQARIPITKVAEGEEVDTWKQHMVDHVVSLIPEELEQQAATLIDALYAD